MSNEEQVSPWLTQWQTNGSPDWAIAKQTVQRVTNIIHNWFRDHATAEERLEKQEHGFSETFNAAIEAKFPGVTDRLVALGEEYLRLRSFDPMTKEDYMIKNDAETVAFQAICDANIQAIAIKGNEVFGKPIFEVPEVTESHEDLNYD